MNVAAPSVNRFFTSTLLITYALQLPALAAHRGWIEWPAAPLTAIAALGAVVPSCVALGLAHRSGGRPALSALLSPLARWRVPLVIYAVALLLPGLLLAAVLRGFVAAGREGTWLYVPSAATIAVGALVALGEEVGWRGLAMPRLAARYGTFAASGIVGVVWAIWHLPMLALVGAPLAWWPVFLLYFVGGSLFFTGVQRAAGGSLLVVIAAHLGAHLHNSHRALPNDTLPLLVHAVVYAALGMGLTWRAAQERRRSRPHSASSLEARPA